MALDFPPDFPFHRRPAAPREPAPSVFATGSPVANNSPDHLAPSLEARAATVAAVGPRLSESVAAPRVARRPHPPAAPAESADPLPTAVDRRRSPRQTLVAKATIRPDSSVQMASLVQAGFVSNISMNGVGFHTRKPLEVGGTYRITLELGPLKWASRLRVISCRHHEESETFDVGGQFIGNELSRLSMAA